MFRRVILVLFFISLFPMFVFASEESYQLFITEFIPNPIGLDSKEEWIEVYNSGETIDISGFYIVDMAGSIKKFIIPDGTTINQSEYLSFYSSNTKISLNNTGDGVALYTPDDILIDESDICGTSKEGYSYALSNSTWQWTSTPTPDAENIITEDEPEPEEASESNDEEDEEDATQPTANLYVTEFMPNPVGSDADGEWIEIYNAGSTSDIGGYIIADKYGSPKKYNIPKGTTIGSKKYLVFYSSKTPISLNNDGDAVEIKSPDGKVLDSSGESCGTGKEGFSYAFTGSKWVWTKKPTPGSQNVISEPSREELEDSDADNSSVKTEVMGDLEEYQFSEEEKEQATENDKLLGYILIVVAIVGGISYTLYIKKEKILEFYKQKRGTNNKDWEKLWRKGKGK